MQGASRLRADRAWWILQGLQGVQHHIWRLLDCVLSLKFPQLMQSCAHGLLDVLGTERALVNTGASELLTSSRPSRDVSWEPHFPEGDQTPTLFCNQHGNQHEHPLFLSCTRSHHHKGRSPCVRQLFVQKLTMLFLAIELHVPLQA